MFLCSVHSDPHFQCSCSLPFRFCCSSPRTLRKSHLLDRRLKWNKAGGLLANNCIPFDARDDPDGSIKEASLGRAAFHHLRANAISWSNSAIGLPKLSG